MRKSKSCVLDQWVPLNYIHYLSVYWLCTRLRLRHILYIEKPTNPQVSVDDLKLFSPFTIRILRKSAHISKKEVPNQRKASDKNRKKSFHRLDVAAEVSIQLLFGGRYLSQLTCTIRPLFIWIFLFIIRRGISPYGVATYESSCMLYNVYFSVFYRHTTFTRIHECYFMYLHLRVKRVTFVTKNITFHTSAYYIFTYILFTTFYYTIYIRSI